MDYTEIIVNLQAAVFILGKYTTSINNSPPIRPSDRYFVGRLS